MSKKQKRPRQYSLVKFETTPKYWKDYPFKPKQVLVFLSDIPNMKGHCITIDYKTGKIYSGYHTDNFVEIPEDET